LKNWDGNGLLLEPLIAWADVGAELQVGVPIALHARVRDLRVLDDLSTVSWTQISGPGAASFADSAALETTATFDQSGSYVLELAVSGGGSNYAATTALTIGGDTTPPDMPLGLSAMLYQNGIRLVWDESPDPEPVTYRVYRRTASSGFGAPLVGDLPSSDYEDPIVAPGVTYLYVVTAVDASGNESTPSAEFTITTMGIVTTTFDFGTDPGKITASAAGFSLSTSGESGFNNRADGLEAVAAASSGFVKLAFLRSFPGLQGALFTQTTSSPVSSAVAVIHTLKMDDFLHLRGENDPEVRLP